MAIISAWSRFESRDLGAKSGALVGPEGSYIVDVGERQGGLDGAPPSRTPYWLVTDGAQNFRERMVLYPRGGRYGRNEWEQTVMPVYQPFRVWEGSQPFIKGFRTYSSWE